jgi:hypothetical protein
MENNENYLTKLDFNTKNSNMQTQVHHKSFVIDQWTGESIDSIKKFKIPTKGLKTWKGSYGTPSTALAGLTNYISKTLTLTKDESDELFSVFQSTLVKSDVNEKYPHFTITAAPSFMMLCEFGGKLSIGQYHDIYGHDVQREIYSQIITHNGDDMEVTTPPPPKSDSSILWTMRSIATMESNKEEDDSVTQSTIPRCVGSWLDFLRSMTHNDTPHALVFYFHPKNDKIFGIGKPNDWNVSLNKRVGNLFNKLPVFGDVRVISKDEGGSGLAKKRAKLE